MRFGLYVWDMSFWYEICALGMRYELLVWDFGFRYEIWATGMRYGLHVWDMGYRYDIWATGRRYGLQVWDLGYRYMYVIFPNFRVLLENNSKDSKSQLITTIYYVTFVSQSNLQDFFFLLFFSLGMFGIMYF